MTTAFARSTPATDAETPNERQIVEAFRSPPARRLDVGYARLAYYRFGRGPDVVFVHGWPLHGATFRRVIPLLAGDFTCHVLDLPGAGQSEWDDDAPLDVVSHATAVRRALDRIGLERYALLAHDSGGFIARLVAEGDRRVAGLVLGNTEIPGHTPWLVALYAAVTKLPGGAALLRNSMRSRAIRRSFLGFGGCFEDVAFADGEFHELFVRPLLEQSRRSDAQMAVLRNLDGSTTRRLIGVPQRITAPVRLIWGTDDPFFPIERARRMVHDFSGPAELCEIPGGKLFVHEDRPDAFVRHAKPFLERCLAKPS